MEKVDVKAKKEYEKEAFFTRELMALIANVNRGSKNSKIFTGEDFFKLSSDKEKEDQDRKAIKLTPEEVEAKFNGKRHIS